MSSTAKTVLVIGALAAVGWYFLIRPKQQAQKQEQALQQQAQAIAQEQAYEQMSTSAYTGYGSANYQGPLFIYGNNGPEAVSFNGSAIGGPGSGLPAPLSPLQSSGQMANII